MQHLSPLELNKLLQTSPSDLYLLDVREAHEFAHCHIPDSQLVPMQTIPASYGELPKDKTIVVICHHGMRSQQVANFLEQQGLSNLANLEGGVHAWAEQVDPAMPRY